MTNGEKLKQTINNMTYRELYEAFTNSKGSDFAEEFCLKHCSDSKIDVDCECSDKCMAKFEEWCNKEC